MPTGNRFDRFQLLIKLGGVLLILVAIVVGIRYMLHHEMTYEGARAEQRIAGILGLIAGDLEGSGAIVTEHQSLYRGGLIYFCFHADESLIAELGLRGRLEGPTATSLPTGEKYPRWWRREASAAPEPLDHYQRPATRELWWRASDKTYFGRLSSG